MYTKKFLITSEDPPVHGGFLGRTFCAIHCWGLQDGIRHFETVREGLHLDLSFPNIVLKRSGRVTRSLMAISSYSGMIRGLRPPMENENLQRMIKLAEEFFETKNDPDQISVTREVVERLKEIHPGTMTEETDEKGPIAWILVIPTTRAVMEEFIAGKITEQGLLNTTPLHEQYEALYLCSALVLPEHRGKGVAKRLLTRAVRAIRKDHPIRELFYWAFSPEGDQLAAAVARDLGLPLLKRKTD